MNEKQPLSEDYHKNVGLFYDFMWKPVLKREEVNSFYKLNQEEYDILFDILYKGYNPNNHISTAKTELPENSFLSSLPKPILAVHRYTHRYDSALFYIIDGEEDSLKVRMIGFCDDGNLERLMKNIIEKVYVRRKL